MRTPLLETLYVSKYTGKKYIEVNGNIDTQKPVERNLWEYTHTEERGTFDVYTKELNPETSAGELQEAVKLGLPPLLTGEEARKFWISKPNGWVSFKTWNSLERNHKCGYFKHATGKWITFDNRGGEWTEESHEEEKLCIEWFKK